jgi:hypothetical protein
MESNAKCHYHKKKLPVKDKEFFLKYGTILAILDEEELSSKKINLTNLCHKFRDPGFCLNKQKINFNNRYINIKSVSQMQISMHFLQHITSMCLFYLGFLDPIEIFLPIKNEKILATKKQTER